MAGAAAVFALSPADIDIVRVMGAAAGAVTVVPNGVAAPVPVPPDRVGTVLAGLGIPAEPVPGELTCLFLANHTPNKGLPVLLEAFAGLDHRYLLIVAGEQRAGLDYAGYQRRCRAGQRIVVTGRVSDEAVEVLYRRADVFVFPTLADTFPLVVLEAAAHGLAVVASRVGGIPYQISQECGVLVEPGDVAGLRAALEYCAADPQRLARLGDNARRQVADRFTWPVAAEAALAGYRRVLAGPVR